VTNPQNQSSDPYAPPPRYREKSGAVLRVAILGALLAGAAWGYMQFANAPQTALVEPATQEQVMAEARDVNTPYQVQTPEAAPAVDRSHGGAACAAARRAERHAFGTRAAAHHDNRADFAAALAAGRYAFW
jgi:hypothetical protein